MKLLLLDRDFHHKNREALYAYKNINITPFYDIQILDKIDITAYDAVYSPTYPIDVSKYPKTRFLFGPHFSVFPEENLRWIKGPNTTYIQPSKWAADVWRTNRLCRDMDIRPIPFGVHTSRFVEKKPISERTEVFVYYKTRCEYDLLFIKEKLKELNIQYTLISYDSMYPESEYLHCLQNAKYGIWVGRHESQGFALEEALSCNVPLLVWDVLSMNQETGVQYDDIPATTVPYWDSRCGEVFYSRAHFDYTYRLFMSKLRTFTPREYILANLSIEKCEEQFLKLVPCQHTAQ